VKNRVAANRRVEPAFQRRSARAETLASQSSSAVQPLRFAAGLYRVQAEIAAAIESAHQNSSLTGSLALDADRFLETSRLLLRYAADRGPAPLAETARRRREEELSLTRSRLLAYWSGEARTADDYLSRALLRPYAEVLADARVTPDRLHRADHCPFCGGLPWIAARRSASNMDGAQRLLGCALCGGEWLLARIHCPSCQEENPEKLPSFQSDAHPFVRIEACETCHRYLKSIDQTEDARSIPEVDDLLSLAMDLWAVEQGFTRIEPGLAGF
jgi:formate dehydrogenase accessory protein FdhE